MRLMRNEAWIAGEIQTSIDVVPYKQALVTVQTSDHSLSIVAKEQYEDTSVYKEVASASAAGTWIPVEINADAVCRGLVQMFRSDTR